MVVSGRLGRRGLYFQNGFRFVLIKRGFAFSAKIIVRPELDKMAMVAKHHLSGINRGQCCSHLDFRRCQSGHSKSSLAVVSGITLGLSTENSGKNRKAA